jgi:hypothetical protein
MVVGLTNISLMSLLVCVYDSITNSFLEVVVMEQLQLASVNLCSRGVCVDKHHIHATHISMQFWSTSLNIIKRRFENMKKMQKMHLH